MAKKVEAILPGNIYYLHFDKPRLATHTLEWRRKQPNYGRDLIIDGDETGNKSLGYFRIHVDPIGYIHSITYLGTRSIAVDNILCLYGMHEKYLNRLVARFDEGVIKDFVEFFEESWALPLMHDRFQAFVKWSRVDLMSRKLDSDMEDIMKQLSDAISLGVKISEEERKQMYSRFDQGTERKFWDQNVSDKNKQRTLTLNICTKARELQSGEGRKGVCKALNPLG
ncbi:hypothetical protein HK096_006800 [Nowakowskiella sp. JEL0078]|nr:hypothetical protein HK096_006800 [Nowakowskiella sp. JEL0078]